VVLSPDGSSVAVGGFNSPVELWDVRTGKSLRRIGQGRLAQPKIAFTPDSRCLIVEDSNAGANLRLFEVSSGQERAAYRAWNQRAFAFAADGSVLIVAGNQGIQVLDTLAGRELDRLNGHVGEVRALAVSPDGRTFASGGIDTSIVVWDAKPLFRKGVPPIGKVDDSELQHLWNALGDSNAHRAHVAVWSLIAVPLQSVPLLKTRLQPIDAAEFNRIAQYVADLDSANFQARLKATKMLEKFGDLAEPQLVKALAGKPNLEMTQRIEKLLVSLQAPSADKLQKLRALEVLEHAGTPDARKVLTTLAGGFPDQWLTDGARKSLTRLKTAD
jgi:hypothetical protein